MVCPVDGFVLEPLFYIRYDCLIMKQIPLTQGYFALIDDTDFKLISKYSWTIHKKAHGVCYAQRTVIKRGKSGSVYMHRSVKRAQKGQIVDHINGNGMDNRRANLRLCSQAANLQRGRIRSSNTSGFRGVSKSNGKWKAQIAHERKNKHLGYFSTKEDAAKAYDTAAAKIFGKYAGLNFPAK